MHAARWNGGRAAHRDMVALVPVLPQASQYIARVESAYKTARTTFFQLRALWSGIT